jgi:hypothetical protein
MVYLRRLLLPDTIASDGRMNSELKRMIKEVVVA